jgi:ABC-type Fe3+ transport system permease subunit
VGILAASPANSYRRREALVTAASYGAGTFTAAAFVATGSACVALGWRDLQWVLASPRGPASALAATLLAVAVALPLTAAASCFAAVCASETAIGGRAGAVLRKVLEPSSGIPPVTVGLAVFLVALQLQGNGSVRFWVIVATLSALNLPNASARFAGIFAGLPMREREAALAAGASPVAAFFGVIAPRSAMGLAAEFFSVGAQMAGETSAIVAAGAAGRWQPLSALVWRYASNPALANTEAASCTLLVLVVAAFVLLARACRAAGASGSAAGL